LACQQPSHPIERDQICGVESTPLPLERSWSLNRR
jgi:hypothetical protein